MGTHRGNNSSTIINIRIIVVMTTNGHINPITTNIMIILRLMKGEGVMTMSPITRTGITRTDATMDTGKHFMTMDGMIIMIGNTLTDMITIKFD